MGTTLSSNPAEIPTEIIEESKKELLKDLTVQLKNDIKINKEKHALNPSFYNHESIQCTTHMGDYVEDNTLLNNLISTLNKLYKNFEKDIAAQILKTCFTQAEYKTGDIVKIFEYAASGNFKDICQLFYQTYGMHLLTYHNKNGWQSLHRCAAKNDVIAAKIYIDLVDNKWEYINSPGVYMKESALFRATLTGATEVVQLLLETAGEQACYYIMNDNNDRHCSLFDGACNNGYLEVIKLLANTVGADNIWTLINLHNENAFITACSNGQTEIVRFLLEAVGDRKMELILKENSYKRTGLYYVSFNNYPKVVKVIIEQAGDRVKELPLYSFIGATETNKGVEIATYLKTFL